MDLPKIVSRKVRYAVVGLGTLAVEEILPAFAQSQYSQLSGLVSGEKDKLKHLGKVFGVPEDCQWTYDQYEELLSSGEIDAIYIVLPNVMHADYTIRALKAGKHVLCEKPMAATIAECEAMNQASAESGAKLMLAYRLQYEPLNRQVVEWMREERFGKIQSILSCNMQMTTAPDIRLESEMAGGPVGDIGIYSINAARYITGEEPESVFAVAHAPANSRFNEVPANVSFILTFPSGVHASCTCGFDSAIHRSFSVHCQEGVVRMDPSFSYNGLRLFYSEKGEEVEVPGTPFNQFAGEIDHFSECVLHDRAPRSGGDEGLKDIRVIAAIHRSVEQGCAVSIDDPALAGDYPALTRSHEAVSR